MDKRNVLIVGAGIGGLAAALALHADGHEVTLAEAASEIRALGVGINLLPHAVAVLDRLDLLGRLRTAAVETEALVFANRFGQTIYRDPRGLAAGASHPQLSIHRGTLHAALVEAARDRLGDRAFRLGHRLIDIDCGGARPSATFDTALGPAAIEAELIVAADGIHSAARRRFHPQEGPPRWNGVMMWRGTTRGKPFLGGRTMVQAGTGDAKFVVYPITRPDAAGDVLINWICDIRVRPRIDGTYEAPSRQDWMKPGRVEELLAVFGGWRFDWLDVPGIIRDAAQILEWPMVDRDPLPTWRSGNVVLLGDAAHPMYPIGSNGATQAILDADALAGALRRAPLEEALSAYEAARLPMARGIVLLNRQQGLDRVLDLVDERAPNGFDRIEDVIDPALIAADIDRYKSVAGHQGAAAKAVR